MSQTKRTKLSQDEAFELLSSPRRRYVIYFLNEQGTAVELGRLADEVASWENEIPVEDLSSQQRKRVYVSLYQTHIPKLEELGIVDYDPDEGTVAVTDRLEDIERYLSTETEDRRWDVYYLSLALVSVAIYGAVALGVVSLSLVGELIIGGLILAAFAAVAIFHWMNRQGITGESLRRVVELEE